MFGFIKEVEAKERVRKAKEAQKSKVEKLVADVKRLNDTIETMKDDSKSTNRQHTRAVSAKTSEIEDLNIKLTAVQKVAGDAQANEKERLELEGKRITVEAKEKQFKSFETELKTLKKEAEEKAEEQYQSGYSDGLADGLRKIHEITAEDRKQAMQVAALAASSHTPEAANIVADAIRKDMMALPAGKKTGGKK